MRYYPFLRILGFLGLIFLLLQVSQASSGQEPEPERELFVRILVYPTFNLSRYDYNNDLDLVELRTYVELREESQAGEVIPDARVKIDAEDLDFNEDHYEKRIRASKDNLPETFRISIHTLDGRKIDREYTIPDWLILQSPQPSIKPRSQGLHVSWGFKHCGGRVNIRVYDFKTGEEIIRKDYIPEKELVIPASQLPESGIVRIYVLCSWFYKKYLESEAAARGSEINIMPWSQVFVRIRKDAAGDRLRDSFLP